MNTYYFAWRANATIAEACGAEKDVPSKLLLLTHVEFRDVEVCKNNRYQIMRIRIGYTKLYKGSIIIFQPLAKIIYYNRNEKKILLGLF